MKKNMVTFLFWDLKRLPEIKALIPMGYTPGIPMLKLRQDNLCMMVPYLCYKVTGEKDNTLVFPIRFVTEYLIPENKMVSFTDLAYTSMAGSVDFNKPCGTFRHEAIANLSRLEYDALRNATLSSLDKVASYLLDDGEFSAEDYQLLTAQLDTIIEPSLRGFYSVLSPDFFNKYFNNGKNKPK